MTIITRIRRGLADAAYGQTRLLELRTGLTLTGPRRHSTAARRQVARLDAIPTLPAEPAIDTRDETTAAA